ncbi:hypothetical protein [Rhizobium mayense]|uniref:Uncharacterized protein n=1 Tax=Rhizobium mayense TaxID=1312184 RepID=A0ABT7JZ47_9HYPH|nr:hypothetical protein [Rhizobium mayense]MDL2401587.1 hypothetical protein [Rhizobium mayense]
MPNTAVQAAGEAMLEVGALNRLQGMLKAGDVQGALSLLLEQSMVPTVQISDPLLDAINAYWAGIDDFNLNAPEDDDGANAYAGVSYGPPMRVLEEWNEPARTLEGALTALKIALRDSKGVHGSDAAEKMILAAIGYLEAVIKSRDVRGAIALLDVDRSSLNGAAQAPVVGTAVEGKAPAASDPIIDAIGAFQAKWRDYLTAADGEADRLSHLWKEPHSILVNWSQRCITREGAIVALRFAIEDNEMGESYVIDPLMRAALGYLEAVAAVSSAADEKEEADSSISEMFAQWNEARRRGYENSSEEEHEKNYAKYRDLREHIVVAHPATPKDLAIQFVVDTDEGDSEGSEAFRKKIFALAGVPVEERGEQV